MLKYLSFGNRAHIFNFRHFKYMLSALHSWVKKKNMSATTRINQISIFHIFQSLKITKTPDCNWVCHLVVKFGNIKNLTKCLFMHYNCHNKLLFKLFFALDQLFFIYCNLAILHWKSWKKGILTKWPPHSQYGWFLKIDHFSWNLAHIVVKLCVKLNL